MLLKDYEEYNLVWDKVYDTLHFNPSVDSDIIPFEISMPHTVYDICHTIQPLSEQFDRMILDALTGCTAPGERLYALEWQHCAFIFDPRDTEQMQSVSIDDPRYPFGGYNADFPLFYPDGDYYFFIDEHFRFGYLSHPWRQEVWVFGKDLIAEFKKIENKLGWTKKESI